MKERVSTLGDLTGEAQRGPVVTTNCEKSAEAIVALVKVVKGRTIVSPQKAKRRPTR